MIDISNKDVVRRVARAKGEIQLKPQTITLIKEGKVKKGDVLTVARVAGMNAVKSTHTLIPMCHPIPVDFVGFDFEIKDGSVTCACQVKAEYKTGVEMEALVGVTTALLTIWDMVKYAEKDEAGQYPHARITDIQVIEKSKNG
jgi:cyclic pyranopterin phosphate synthase